MEPESVATLKTIVSACFVGTWFVLGIGGFFLFYLGKNVPSKRKWFPRYAILAGVLFLLFSTTLMALSSGWVEIRGMLTFMVPAVMLISYLNIRLTKFCDRCGATLLSQNWFVPMKFCPKCGSELDPKSRSDGPTDLSDRL